MIITILNLNGGYLKKMFDEGFIYEGFKVTPYCPRCGTPLASHEVAQGYETDSVNTVYVPFKVKNQDNTYLLIWTTTPWTLLANVGVCVNPGMTYVKVRNHRISIILLLKVWLINYLMKIMK